jgi:hypothetical protein
MATIAFYVIALALFYSAWYGWVRATGGWWREGGGAAPVDLLGSADERRVSRPRDAARAALEEGRSS